MYQLYNSFFYSVFSDFIKFESFIYSKFISKSKVLYKILIIKFFNNPLPIL